MTPTRVHGLDRLLWLAVPYGVLISLSASEPWAALSRLMAKDYRGGSDAAPSTLYRRSDCGPGVHRRYRHHDDVVGDCDFERSHEQCGFRPQLRRCRASGATGANLKPIELRPRFRRC